MRVIILTKNKSPLLLRLRSGCLISCLYFSSFCRTLERAHAHRQKSRSLSSNWGKQKWPVRASEVLFSGLFWFLSLVSALKTNITSTRSIFLFLILANEFLSWRVTRRRCVNFHLTVLKKYRLWTSFSFNSFFGVVYEQALNERTIWPSRVTLVNGKRLQSVCLPTQTHKNMNGEENNKKENTDIFLDKLWIWARHVYGKPNNTLTLGASHPSFDYRTSISSWGFWE